MFVIGIDFDGVVGSLADYLPGGVQYHAWCDAIANEDQERARNNEQKITCIEHANIHREKHVDNTSPIYLREVPGALGGLRLLIDRGYTPIIVTYRIQEGVEHARHWLLEHGIDIPIFSAEADKTKLFALQRNNALVHLDDVPGMLEDLHPHVPHRFLFHWDYNADKVISEGITRVYTWPEFIDKVLAIKVCET